MIRFTFKVGLTVFLFSEKKIRKYHGQNFMGKMIRMNIVIRGKKIVQKGWKNYNI